MMTARREDQNTLRIQHEGPKFNSSIPRCEHKDASGTQVVHRLSDHCYHVYGRGHLTEPMMRSVFTSIDNFKLKGPYVGIVDWFDLASYESGARSYGQRWAANVHQDIECVYLGTSSKLVWMASQVVNIALKGRLRPFHYRNEMEAAVAEIIKPCLVR